VNQCVGHWLLKYPNDNDNVYSVCSACWPSTLKSLMPSYKKYHISYPLKYNNLSSSSYIVLYLNFMSQTLQKNKWLYKLNLAHNCKLIFYLLNMCDIIYVILFLSIVRASFHLYLTVQIETLVWSCKRSAVYSCCWPQQRTVWPWAGRISDFDGAL